MARIKKITPSNAISDFRQAAPDAGGAFRFLGGLAQEAYDFLAPAAAQEMQAAGVGLGSEIARQQIGDPQAAVSLSTMGRAVGFNEALGQSESGGDYSVVNSEGFTGKYQWGQARLDDFNRANGSAHSLDEFRANPALQEQAQAWHIGDIDANLAGLVGRTVQGRALSRDSLRAMAHLGGVAGARRFVETDGAYDPADSNGTRLSDYADRFDSNVTTSMSTMNGPPRTMIRDADGALTARLYSPLSGPLLQAHNAAAGVAYQSEMILKGQTDLLDLSSQFSLDPAGFQQAAQGYLDDVVKAAPEMFRADLRASLQGETQRRFLGMVDEKQRDTRQRANNSSAALVDRWSTNLAEAIAGGNDSEIAAARSELSGVLSAREYLPGAAWTAEQSANTMMKAEQAGADLIAKQQADQVKAWKGQLRTITEASQAGRSAADESILDNLAVWALAPEEAREAAANVALRDNLPSFLQLPPAEQREALAEMKAAPVQEEWEIDLFNAAEGAAKANATAWDADPIARAQEVLTDKPPEIVMSLEDPEAFGASLAARAAYAVKLRDRGFVPDVAFFSDAEAEQLGALMGKDADPAIKAMLAGAIVSAGGPNAAQAFREIKSTDTVTRMAGMLWARGGNPQVATAAMTGQAKLDQGVVQPPKKATTVAAVSADIASALSGLPNSVSRTSDLMQMATAIWANNAPPGGYPDDAAEKASMEAAIQQAAGQTTDRQGRLLGGFQEIGGNQVMMPPGMSGEALDHALTAGFSAFVEGGFLARLGAAVGGPEAGGATVWEGAGMPSAPMLQGQPIRPRDWRAGRVVLTPEGGNMYRLSLRVGDTLTDARTADGQPFIVDAQKLIEVAQ